MNKKLMTALFIPLSVLWLLSGCESNVSSSSSSSTGNSSSESELERKTASKDETIYINTNADGEITLVQAVNRLADVSDGLFLDYGSYSSVTNLTTSETPILTDDYVALPVVGEYTNFYYQTTLNQGYELPFLVHLSYFVHGVETVPASLAGISGEVTIDLAITANPNTPLYFQQTMMCQAQLPISLDNTEIIAASGAMKVLIGRTMTLAYMVLPGQSAEYQIILSTTSFALEDVSLSISAIDLTDLLGIDLGEFSTFFSSLKTGMQGMIDGETALMGGLTQLGDALNQLHSGLDQYVAGNDEFLAQLEAVFGMLSELNDNLQTLSTSLSSLSSTGANLNNGYSDLSDNLGQFLDYVAADLAVDDPHLEQIDQLKLQLTSFGDALAQYVGGMTLIADNLALVATGFQTLVAAIPALQSGADDLTENLSILTEALGDLASSFSAIPDQIAELISGQEEMLAGIELAQAALANWDFTGTSEPIVSFTSPQNLSPRSVQFVIKVAAITIRSGD